MWRDCCLLVLLVNSLLHNHILRILVRLLKLKVVVLRGLLGKHSWEDERIWTLFLLLSKRGHQTFQVFWGFVDKLLVNLRRVSILLVVHRVEREIWQAWQVLFHIEGQVPNVFEHEHLLGTGKVSLVWGLEGRKIGGTQLFLFLLKIFKKSLFFLTFAWR